MHFQFSESAYKVCKFIAVIFLPALATFYAGMAALWGWANTTAVVGTITLSDTFLGTLLTISTLNFNKVNPQAAVTAVDKVVDDVVVNVLGEKNTPYDADTPKSHRKED